MSRGGAPRVGLLSLGVGLAAAGQERPPDGDPLGGQAQRGPHPGGGQAHPEGHQPRPGPGRPHSPPPR